jgi:hypothetical protein
MGQVDYVVQGFSENEKHLLPVFQCQPLRRSSKSWYSLIANRYVDK